MLKTSNSAMVSDAQPEAKICLNRNRLKIYQDKFIYLNNQDEFSFELYNPTQNTILVKINLDGKSISNSGLVLRQGERVFLDRFLDEARKFKFDTYEVKDTKQNKHAIEKNGLVSIEFFDEYIPYYWNIYNGTTTIGNPIWTTGTAIGGINNSTFTCGNSTYAVNNCSNSNTIETGKVDKGSISNQKFDYSNKSFNSFAFKTIEYQILPKSQKPIEMKEIRNYCGFCSSKVKKEHRFCPSCGTKI